MSPAKPHIPHLSAQGVMDPTARNQTDFTLEQISDLAKRLADLLMSPLWQGQEERLVQQFYGFVGGGYNGHHLCTMAHKAMNLPCCMENAHCANSVRVTGPNFWAAVERTCQRYRPG